MSREVLAVKPRLNQINSHVHTIRAYPIVNYPERGGVDESDGQWDEWQGDRGTLIESCGRVLCYTVVVIYNL